MKTLKAMIAVSAIFALTAIGICALELTLAVRDSRAIGAATAVHLQLTLTHLDATVTDLDRTVQIAGGAIDQARKIERDNRAEIAAVNRGTLAALNHVDELIVSLDASQKQAAASIVSTAGAVQQTSAALVPVMEQSRADLAALQPAIQQVTPLLQRSTDIAVNLSNATADVEQEIHKFVYPPPRKWYQKYLLDPLKMGLHLVTIPLGHV